MKGSGKIHAAAQRTSQDACLTATWVHSSLTKHNTPLPAGYGLVMAAPVSASSTASNHRPANTGCAGKIPRGQQAQCT